MLKDKEGRYRVNIIMKANGDTYISETHSHASIIASNQLIDDGRLIRLIIFLSPHPEHGWLKMRKFSKEAPAFWYRNYTQNIEKCREIYLKACKKQGIMPTDYFKP